MAETEIVAYKCPILNEYTLVKVTSDIPTTVLLNEMICPEYQSDKTCKEKFKLKANSKLCLLANGFSEVI